MDGQENLLQTQDARQRTNTLTLTFCFRIIKKGGYLLRQPPAIQKGITKLLKLLN